MSSSWFYGNNSIISNKTGSDLNLTFCQPDMKLNGIAVKNLVTKVTFLFV